VCKVCEQGIWEKKKKYRMSDPVVTFGQFLLRVSIVGILFGGFLFFTTGSKTISSYEARERSNMEYTLRSLDREMGRHRRLALIEVSYSELELSEEQKKVIMNFEKDLMAKKTKVAQKKDIAFLVISTSFIGGLLGWLLTLKKKVIKCSLCGTVVSPLNEGNIDRDDDKEELSRTVEEKDEKGSDHLSLFEILIVLFIITFFVWVAVRSFGAKIQALMKSPGPNGCIAHGTKILTPSGLEAIENLTVGSSVLSQNQEGGLETAHVTWKGQFVTKQYLKLNFSDGSFLECTPTHPLGTMSGWIKVGKLRNGDWVLARKGQIQINGIQALSAPQTVFNITVEPSPTYFANGVLVHNKSISDPTTDHTGSGR